jgi:hypothetical protein
LTIQKDNVSVVDICNNACILLGEFAHKLPLAVKSHVSELFDVLGEILNSEAYVTFQKKNEMLIKRFAVTIAFTLGRLGMVDPILASTYLPKIIRPWCVSLRYISNSDEKRQAFAGLC